MLNIGKEIEKKLKSIGICSTEELKQTGSKEAFLRLKTRYSNVCLVHLYTLQGAIDDVGLSNSCMKREDKCFSISYPDTEERLEMEWIEKLNEVINYLEEHIAEEIDYEQVSKIACCSSYHFQRPRRVEIFHCCRKHAGNGWRVGD